MRHKKQTYVTELLMNIAWDTGVDGATLKQT